MRTHILAGLCALISIALAGCGSATSPNPAPAPTPLAPNPIGPAEAPIATPLPAAPAGPKEFAIDGDNALVEKLGKALDESKLWKDFIATHIKDKSAPLPFFKASITSTRTTGNIPGNVENPYKGGDVVMQIRIVENAAGNAAVDLKRKKVLPSVLNFRGGDPQQAGFEQTEAALINEMAAQTALMAMSADKANARVFIPTMAAVLSDEKGNADVRATAAQSIGMQGGAAKEQTPLLVKYACRVLDTNRVATNACVDALATLGADALPALADAVKDKDPNVSGNATRVLGKIGEPAVPALVQGLEVKAWLSYSAITKQLGSMGPAAAAAVPVLLADLKSKDTMIRQNAAETLGQIGKPSVPGLLQALNSETDEALCAAMLNALGNMGADAADALPQLETLSKKYKGYLAGRANDAIKRIKNPPAK